jgi:hypothetical protein
MGLLQYITTQCDQLTATAGPSVQQSGVQIVIALATIMMVWFGIQEAIASAQGGPGFSMVKFLDFAMLIMFAYTMVAYYDTAIPGLGFSFHSFIRDGTNGLVQEIGYDTHTNVIDQVTAATAQLGGVMPTFISFYAKFVLGVMTVLLSALSAFSIFILAYGAIGATVVGLLGPVFIPFLVIRKLDFLFWGWFKAFLAFSFYKVVAAATLSVVSTVFAAYFTQHFDPHNPTLIVQNFPIIMVLVLVSIFIITKIPLMVSTIFSGSTGGHDGGMGIATAIALKTGL